MSEARQIIDTIINNFSPDKFSRFFREKSRQFNANEENYSRYNDDDFKNGIKIGEINFQDNESLIACAFEVKKPLAERTGKKAQYEKAKSILKSAENQRYSAGIFIFYDPNGNFRFSLVYPEAIGTKKQWSNFRRLTYFVSKDFTNKTFKKRIGDGDFSTLVKIKDAFSVEKVTKEFYEDIANWYFWAVEHCQFPKDAEAADNGRNIAVIRLITRIIFIWFMRERGLVSKELFVKGNISEILNKLESEESTYYKAILQNLFFATLSTKKEERQFSSEIRGHKGYNPDFGNQYVFRYQEAFKEPEKIKEYFGSIPFLNGGLFECLDDKPNGIIIDGFSRVKKNQPIIPNFLFFSAEKKADLNTAYGTKNKTYKVRGLLDILSSFNFTIDENSPDDADIALDPELLGRVFENLLASFNPETSTTARKATGSYYTPREIVDYMVGESLKSYFKTHLEELGNIDEKLNNLLSNANDKNPFSANDSKKLVKLIENVKIVDPAVGSGAFPMGALNKLVFILNKVDPGNELWKQAQIEAADTIPDPSVRREAKAKIAEFFRNKNANYGRKLFLIQRCIYGVDIQLTAVEITKLRFFISLLVDEEIDIKKGNSGIEPLPNLDFKIMQGNSLIELLAPDLLAKNTDSERSKLIDELNVCKDDFLSISDPIVKKKCKERILELVRTIVNYDKEKEKKELERKLGFFNEKQKLFDMAGDNLDLDDAVTKQKAKISAELKQLEKTQALSPKDHFEWHLHFNEVFESEGFDIVIGNPPYVSVKAISVKEKKVLCSSFVTGEGRFNLFTLFIERGYLLLRGAGTLTFIIPEGIYSNIEYRHTRKLLLEKTKINRLCLFSSRVFEASVDTTVLSFLKILKKNKNIPIDKDIQETELVLSQEKISKYPFNIFPTKLKKETTRLIDDAILSDDYDRILDCLEIQQGIIYSGQKKEDVFSNKIINKTYKKCLDGRDILKWFINWDAKIENKYISYTTQLHRAREERLYLANKKILIPRRATTIYGTIDDMQFYVLNTAYICLNKNEKDYYIEYLLALLNSSYINFIYNQLFFGWQITIPALEILPVKKINKANQEDFKVIVEKIILAKKQNIKVDISTFEKQIDQMVYKLYELTPEEIQIVEKSLPK
ncbi:Eco57I restriction-modification methylase domain-containing protein [Patescibacteria group bacterium]|nr:Eco57I restriction-modification methylase domain-containing protein [Patescibacteria group bacterium]MBU1683550.1 Eco57I restriction-modification methylase domain-containing protein [Patescibacteria group bacterium]